MSDTVLDPEDTKISKAESFLMEFIVGKKDEMLTRKTYIYIFLHTHTLYFIFTRDK